MSIIKATFKDHLQLHFLVVIWGFTAILGKKVEISALYLTFYRTLLAALGLYVVLVLTKQLVQLSSRLRWQMLGVGVLMGLHWLTFFASARFANVSVCLAGMATTSVWTALLDPILSKRKVSWVELSLGLIVVVGLVIILGFEFERAALGLALAIVSAILAAFFTIFNSRFAQNHHSLLITYYEMLGGCFVTASMSALIYFTDANEHNFWPSTSDWLWIGLLAWLCTVYAYSVGIALLRRITPFVFNLTVNLEPVYGIVLAFLIFGESERMTPAFYVGTVVILLAVVGYPLMNRK
jgi:drug/metabolite transporter (DMT)-like permease